MSTILITGTSGFIGQALARSMTHNHQVICFSRKPTPVEGVTRIEDDFLQAESRSQLDEHKIDVLIHLGAVTGGGSEEGGLRVNYEKINRNEIPEMMAGVIKWF